MSTNDVLERILDAGRRAEGDGESSPPVALSIAGSDSGGGAGLQADLKTFAACGVHGTTVVAAITAQNTEHVEGVEPVSEQMVHGQYRAVVDDLEPAAAKTGALGDATRVRAVSECLQDRPIDSVVIDPVMISKHGDPLMGEEGREVIRDDLLKHATLATPNRHEAEVLSGGHTVRGVDSMKDAARAIHDLGPDAVLIKGRHLEGTVRDIMYDGTGFIEYGADKVPTDRLHGSGCVFSSAITARLAAGQPLPEAVGFARDFITRAIQTAPPLGAGIAPVNPLFSFWHDEDRS